MLSVTNAQTLSNSKHPPQRSTSKRVVRLGYLVVDGQNSSIPCSVRDFSDAGATLAASGWMGLPETFNLYVEPDAIRVSCKIVNRKGSMVQVAFGNIEHGEVRQRSSRRR